MTHTVNKFGKQGTQRPCLPIKLFDCANYYRLLIRIHRAAITAAGGVAAVDDVLVLDGSTRALVNLLPRHVVGELLAELDAHRGSQTALALVGRQHLGRGHGHLALLVLHVLHRGVQVGIDRQELVAHGDAEALQHVRLHRLHVLSHRSLHNRGFNTCVTTCLLTNFVEGQCTIWNWHF